MRRRCIGAAPPRAAPHAAAAPPWETPPRAFVARDAYNAACKKVGVSTEQAEALWAELSGSASQKIIAGATAPRQDAANVNQWHWSELDQLPWAKERLTELLKDVAAKGVPDKGWVKVTKVAVEGEASVSNRKGKRIVAFELKVTCDWKGQVDYDDVEGTLSAPYVSEDVGADDYELKLSAKDAGDASHKKAIKFLQKELPEVQKALRTFEVHEIVTSVVRPGTMECFAAGARSRAVLRSTWRAPLRRLISAAISAKPLSSHPRLEERRTALAAALARGAEQRVSAFSTS